MDRLADKALTYSGRESRRDSFRDAGGVAFDEFIFGRGAELVAVRYSGDLISFTWHYLLV